MDDTVDQHIRQLVTSFRGLIGAAKITPDSAELFGDLRKPSDAGLSSQLDPALFGLDIPSSSGASGLGSDADAQLEKKKKAPSIVDPSQFSQPPTPTQTFQPPLSIENHAELIVASVETLLLSIDQAKRKAFLQDFACRNTLIHNREIQLSDRLAETKAALGRIATDSARLASELRNEHKQSVLPEYALDQTIE